MTMQSLEQILTVIHRIQNSVERVSLNSRWYKDCNQSLLQISSYQRQSQQEAWKETLDVLAQLVGLVQGCEIREFSLQLQPALNDLQRCC